jgi:hypothetical protein
MSSQTCGLTKHPVQPTGSRLAERGGEPGVRLFRPCSERSRQPNKPAASHGSAVAPLCRHPVLTSVT